MSPFPELAERTARARLAALQIGTHYKASNPEFEALVRVVVEQLEAIEKLHKELQERPHQGKLFG